MSCFSLCCLTSFCSSHTIFMCLLVKVAVWRPDAFITSSFVFKCSDTQQERYSTDSHPFIDGQMSFFVTGLIAMHSINILEAQLCRRWRSSSWQYSRSQNYYAVSFCINGFSCFSIQGCCMRTKSGSQDKAHLQGQELRLQPRETYDCRFCICKEEFCVDKTRLIMVCWMLSFLCANFCKRECHPKIKRGKRSPHT